MNELERATGLSNEKLDILYNHPDFDSILSQVEEENSRFKQLPIDQKRLALAMFLVGDISRIEGLWSLFYRRPIPSIEEFLSSDYIGSESSFYDESSPWRRDLLTIFNESSSYWEWIACLSGDTVIPLLNGEKEKIKNLVGKNPFYVYSYDERREITIGRAWGVRQTGVDKIYKIWLDDGSFIKTNARHQLVNPNNRKIMVKNLVEGDELAPFHTRLNGDKRGAYEEVYQLGSDSWQSISHLSGKWKYGNLKLSGKIPSFHHKDCNELNNDPSNLVMKTSKYCALVCPKYRNTDLKIKPLTIIKIEDTGKYEPVYCMTVDKYHNFAILSTKACGKVNSLGVISGNTGAIGTAKTAATRIGHFYNLYRLTSLRNPQLSLGAGESKELCLMFLTITKLKASEALSGIKTLLKACKGFRTANSLEEVENHSHEEILQVVPYFEHKVEGFPRLTFPNGIYIGTGSQLSHTIGSDIFGASLDEAEFRGKASSANNAFELYSELCSRVNSRFVDAKFKLVTLVSSVKQDTGVVAEHINNIDPSSGMTYLSRYSIWEVKSQYRNSFEEFGYFYVLRGTKSHPSRILDDIDSKLHDLEQFHIPENCKIVKVPKHPILLKAFKTNVERALKEQAGEMVSGGERPFDDLSSLEDKSLLGEIHFEAPLLDSSESSYNSLFSQLPKELWTKTPEGLKLKRYPNAKRYCHLDLADSGEAGISLFHKELSRNGQIMYVCDFIGKITSPNRISFTAIEEFLLDLKKVGNVIIHHISADQYQSVFMLQKLTESKVAPNVIKMAMGTKTEPFNTVGNAISEGLVKVGKCPELKKQLLGIYFYDDKVQYETDRKDMADTFVGTVYSAMKTPSDSPVNVYESYLELKNNLDLSKIPGMKEL